jgi:hypothetical protein
VPVQVEELPVVPVAPVVPAVPLVPVVPVDAHVDVPQSNFSDVTQNANALAVIPALDWMRTCVAGLGGPLRILFVVGSQGVVPNVDHATKPEAVLTNA